MMRAIPLFPVCWFPRGTDLAQFRVETNSNGQAEGQINRLKTIKRSMYGRAGPELLRARVMPIKSADLHTK